MSLSTQPYKGARDFYPEDKRIQKYMFSKLRQVVESFGYQEYDAPIIEPTDLYLSKSSDEIVSEQTYSFTDRGGRNVTLRPEMTPTVSRMVAGKRQELAYPLRWYSIPDLWRYERPQAGRLRQHYQLNVDLFGIAGIEADHEIIAIADAILKNFGAQEQDYQIRLNSRLHLEGVFDELDLSVDQRKTLLTLIDKRAKIDAGAFEKLFYEKLEEQKAKKLLGYLNDVHQLPPKIAELIDLLSASGIKNAIFDPSLARGFDYYTDIVFEVFDTHPENNRSMFGGGRYDGLVGLFGVDTVPTVGFGMGDVTLQRFLELHNLLPELAPETDAVVIIIGDQYTAAQKILNELRAEGARLAVDSSGRKIDAQIRSAVKSGVPFVLFIGEEEIKNATFKLRNLKRGEELHLPAKQVAETLTARR
jgi:histidyl-tRNA synthetase